MNTVIELSSTPGVSWETILREESLGYRCYIALVREADGSYSAIVVNLPGCGSCGDSEAEAIENVREAIQGTIASYIDAGKEIPWVVNPTLEEKPAGTVRTMWIVVNA
jgi:predicted RNase H-like HicB family nuclease